MLPRMAPLYSKKGRLHLMVLFDVGAGFVDEFAEVVEDGLREGLGLVDVRVDFGVEVLWGHVDAPVDWRKFYLCGGSLRGNFVGF